jgi:hypothetical protein
VTASDQEALWVLRAQSDGRDAIELLLRSAQPVVIFPDISWLETSSLAGIGIASKMSL